MEKKLTLPEFLKILTSNNVPVPKAMAVASNVFKEYNTLALLVQLDDAKLQVLGVKDKDLRKLVLAAVRKVRNSKSTGKPASDSEGVGFVEPLTEHPNTVQTLITPKKKRKRDDDLNEFLPEAPPDEASAYGSMTFNEVLDEEVLKVKSTVINRAPIMSAWATIVAERLGFDREEALSIGSAYTETNAIAKGISLGIIDESKKREIDAISSEQPYVDLMGRRSLYQTRSSKWRALINGSPVIPSTAFSYISRAFRQTTPYIVGALRLLAESYTPQELNKVGFSLYADFRPKVDGWGKRGEVRCDHILSLRRGGEASDRPVLDPGRSDERELLEGSSSKRAKTFSSEEYEAALDDDLELDDEALERLP